MSETLNDVTEQLQGEDVPSLADFAEEPGGALAPGWYPAEIIEGYSTQKGKTFATEDTVSQKGDSRNLRLCFKVTSGSLERTMQDSYNYRVSDFHPDRLSFIKEMRSEFNGVQGRWSDTDAQRSSLAVAKIGAIEKALGFTLRSKAVEGMLAQRAVGNKVDVRLKINPEGYNEVAGFAPAGTRTKGRKS